MSEGPLLAGLLAEARARLGAASAASETPSLEAQLLLGRVLDKPRTWLLAHPEARLSAEQALDFEALLQRRTSGEPLPYILGHWEFYGLDFLVSPAVLIPRPETELLVEHALAWLKARPGQAAATRAVDVGVGSGCIAVTLAVHTPGLRLVGVDVSAPALQVAQANARRHHVEERIDLVQGDLLGAPGAPAGRGVSGAPGAPIDLLCANLPYIPAETLAGLEVARWEPRLALLGGASGLELVALLLAQAAPRLAPDGLALLEIEVTQGAAALDLARAAFPGAKIDVLPDLAGRDRLLKIQAT